MEGKGEKVVEEKKRDEQNEKGLRKRTGRRGVGARVR